jgi:hypothetical protein
MIKLSINQVEANETSRGYWVGETDAICINTNIPELKNTPVEFYGDDMFDVIHQVQAVLKSKGMPTGIQVV